MSFLATELEKSLVNDKITASCQTNMSPKVLYQNVTKTKRELWKTDKLTSFQKPLNTIRLRCFDRVFRRPYRYFSIALKVVFLRPIAITFSPVIGYGLKFVKMYF